MPLLPWQNPMHWLPESLLLTQSQQMLLQSFLHSWQMWMLPLRSGLLRRQTLQTPLRLQLKTLRLQQRLMLLLPQQPGQLQQWLCVGCLTHQSS